MYGQKVQHLDLLMVQVRFCYKIYYNYSVVLHINAKHLFVVEIREVKEIRIGKQSKDFEKWPEDAKRIENLRCFVVYYGSEFRLKTLSISGKRMIHEYVFLFHKGWLFLVDTNVNLYFNVFKVTFTCIYFSS